MVKTLEENIDSLTEDIPNKEVSSLGEAMQSLDNTGADPHNPALSMVDLNCRLTNDERKLMAVCDETFSSIGLKSSITMVLKRLSVSINGAGREEKVRVIQGERAQQSGGGLGNFLGGMFKGKTE